MKITDMMLTEIETQKKVLPVQSNYSNIAYVVDKRNRVVWLVDRRTGAQIEIDAENLHAFAYELMDVADVHLGAKGIWKVG